MRSHLKKLVFLFVFSNIIIINSTKESTIMEKASTKRTITVTTKQKQYDKEAIAEQIRDIGYYLRAHKFNEYDRRYEINESKAEKNYFKTFPRPPLRALHWEVHKYCVSSFIECINYLAIKVRGTSARRNDDTSVVMTQQKWKWGKHENQIKQVDEDCRKNKRIDDSVADPFEGPLERYQWRVTASYYMCWYTMKQTPELIRFFEKCDNFANCLDYDYGPSNEDERVADYQKFSCSLYSFCPDPCCPFKFLNKMKDCWDSHENPCYRNNAKGHRACSLNMASNIEFNEIILNRWNVTCRCPQQRGYEWNSRYGICIDVDECVSGTHNCKPKVESCLNLPGSFRCICRWGYIWDSEKKQCLPSNALASLKLKIKESVKQTKQLSLWEKFKNIIFRRNSSNIKRCNFIMIYSVIFFNVCLLV